MIELPEMAEFVRDDVIGKLGGQKQNPVVEIEIAFPGTAPPPALGIFNANSFEGKPVG